MMPHKITLTGKAVSPLRVNGNLYSFDMEESGSPSAPKGLPVSQAITYTVFLNKKQLNKAELDEKNIREYKLLVQGEPTLDIPVDQCPGEIGVICFQVSIILDSKLVPEKKEEPIIQEIEQAVEQVASTVEKVESVPEGTEDVIPLQSILVPKGFLRTRPNPQKNQIVMDYIKQHGHLDEPIMIRKNKRKNYVLVDGYRRYVVAQELNMEVVPITYFKENGSHPMVETSTPDHKNQES